MMGVTKKLKIPEPAEALPGRAEPMPVPAKHYVNGYSMRPPYPANKERAMFGLGCFWGAEKCFWQLPGVALTAVGYTGGHTPNPTYEEVCSGMTGHNEVVLVVFDPQKLSYARLLKTFFEAHNSTQGMRQGNDVGTQYRSGIYTFGSTQHAAAQLAHKRFDAAMTQAGFPPVTTEIVEAPEFYFAEDYHQQYLAKNPRGYCGLGGTGVTCPL